MERIVIEDEGLALWLRDQREAGGRTRGNLGSTRDTRAARRREGQRLASRAEALRQRLGVSQTALADRLGLKRSTLQGMLTGTVAPSQWTLDRLRPQLEALEASA